MIDSKSILDFWFVQSTPNMWFKKSENFDELLRTKFNKTIENTRKQFRSKSNISAPLKQRAKR